LTPLLHLGRDAEALQVATAFTQALDMGPHFLSAFAALAEASTGRDAEADEHLGAFLAKGGLEECSGLGLTMYLQVALLRHDIEASGRISAALVPIAGNALIVGDSTAVARHLGDAAVLRGDDDAARDFYDQALSAATQIRFRPEIALTRLALGELLARGD